MICPACKEEMIVVEYEKIELDICVHCRGVWFDADELRFLLDSLDFLNLKADDLFRSPPAPPAEEPRKCSYCRRKMEKVLIGPGAGVMIDRCTRGHGLWFDGGELDTVIRSLQRPACDAADSHKAGSHVGAFLKNVLLAGDEEKKGGNK